MQQSQNIDDIVDERNKFKETVDNDEKCKNDPGYETFHQIYETTTRLFDNEETKKLFDEISVTLGKEASLSLMSFMVVAITNASYTAVAQYNNKMVDLLDEQFRAVVEHINGMNADIEGMKSALSVFRKQLEDLKTTFVRDKIEK